MSGDSFGGGELLCGFCERTWQECQDDICPERLIVSMFRTFLAPPEEKITVRLPGPVREGEQHGT